MPVLFGAACCPQRWARMAVRSGRKHYRINLLSRVTTYQFTKRVLMFLLSSCSEMATELARKVDLATYLARGSARAAAASAGGLWGSW